MSRKIAASIALLSVTYALLLALVTPYANYLINIPDWWYPTFGQNNLSALVWLHVANGIFVFACAAPISATINRLFPENWATTATWVGMLASVYILALTIYLLPARIEVANSLAFVLSLMVDYLKYALFPLMISVAIHRLTRPPTESSAQS